MFTTLRCRLPLFPASLFVAALVLPGGAPVHAADQPPPSFDGAGCYISLPGGVVIVVNRLLQRIQLPIGRREGDESPRQTAYRETLEETGIKVNIGEPLLTLKDDSVHLFSCTPVKELSAADYAGLQPHDRVEVSEVLVIDPRIMVNHDGRAITMPWRFPAMRWMVRMLYALRAAPYSDAEIL